MKDKTMSQTHWIQRKLNEISMNSYEDLRDSKGWQRKTIILYKSLHGGYG